MKLYTSPSPNPFEYRVPNGSSSPKKHDHIIFYMILIAR
jgi:hypothetical protein